jgi:hypothetical protein
VESGARELEDQGKHVEHRRATSDAEVTADIPLQPTARGGILSAPRLNAKR